MYHYRQNKDNTMEQVSSEPDVSFLIGRSLGQLALGQYEFQLHFDCNICIHAFQLLCVEMAGEEGVAIDAENPGQTKELAFLLGHSIQEAKLTEELSLELIFDNQCKLIFYPTSDNYESYQIYNRGDIVVEY
jgi:hypothetical protein